MPSYDDLYMHICTIIVDIIRHQFKHHYEICNTIITYVYQFEWRQSSYYTFLLCNMYAFYFISVLKRIKKKKTQNFQSRVPNEL